MRLYTIILSIIIIILTLRYNILHVYSALYIITYICDMSIHRRDNVVILFENKFQLKYKRRVYKMLHLDEKQLKAMHTRTNLRRLLDYVASSQVEKIAKMCSKGLDPNFHCQETGGNCVNNILTRYNYC